MTHNLKGEPRKAGRSLVWLDVAKVPGRPRQRGIHRRALAAVGHGCPGGKGGEELGGEAETVGTRVDDGGPAGYRRPSRPGFLRLGGVAEEASPTECWCAETKAVVTRW